MDSLKTDKKFTVIVSAYQASHTIIQNLIATEALFHQLEVELHVHAIRAIGVYAGGEEQSFVVHTNSHQQAYAVRALGLHTYEQDCVLIRHNRRHEIKLHNADGFNTLVGEHFKHSSSANVFVGNYTILNGKDFYTVI